MTMAEKRLLEALGLADIYILVHEDVLVEKTWRRGLLRRSSDQLAQDHRLQYHDRGETGQLQGPDTAPQQPRRQQPFKMKDTSLEKRGVGRSSTQI